MSANRVLVGLDGSIGARRALEWAVRQAKSAGAEILAAHILTYSQEFVKDFPPSGLTSWRQRLHDQLEGGWTETVRTSGVAFRCILTEDATVDGGLIRTADDEDVELIVLGAHGGSAAATRLLGAVTYKVSHDAHRPVVIVPVDWHPTDRP